MGFSRLLKHTFWYNSVENWLWFFGVIFIGFLFLSLFISLSNFLIFKFFYKRYPEVSENIHKTIQEKLTKPLRLVWQFIIIWWAIQHLNISYTTLEFKNNWILISKIYQGGFVLTCTWLAVRLTKVVAVLVKFRNRKLRTNPISSPALTFIRDLFILLFVIVGAVLVLRFTFEINITKLVAGLGIGGIAVALAARETIENILASITIFLDAPFIAGDTIKMTNFTGDILKIGFRSTRLRTSDGNVITIPNRMITSQAIENLTHRYFRRTQFCVHISVETPTEIIKKICADLQTILDSSPHFEDQKETNHKSIVIIETIAQNVQIQITFFLKNIHSEIANHIKQELNYEFLGVFQRYNVKILDSNLPPLSIVSKIEKEKLI